ncbi:hypothetical protein [uncultured Roseobacter sp.]|uniref:anti-sigma factor family protein n=1 Tax=uncultured Roseobacter sp. TaxID=114847 RepID=UPI00260AF0C7|nr:hypothetical protein [uncultured Roseobacter sp.]
MQDRYVTDEELVAFLDGEDDLAPVAEIARALEQDAALRRRLEALQIDRAALRDSFAALQPQPGVMPDLSALPSAAPGLRIGSLVAAASLALVIGLGAGSWLARPAAPGWVDYVAAYQALYSTGTLAHVDQDPVAQQAELDRVAAAIGKTISVDTLGMFPEAQYKRAQILSFGGRALVQLAFTKSTGEPLALCIIRTERQDDAAPRIAEREGLSSARWARGGYDYLLIGGTDTGLVSRLAASFMSMEI